MVQKAERPTRAKAVATAGTRPRGRPRAYDPAIALARAADVFWKKGYDGTSLDDLAAATGMNRPSLYAAFGDKRALYLKTLQHYRDEARTVSLSLLADKPPLRVYLARFYKVALDLYLNGGARGCYMIGTAATQSVTDPTVRAFVAESIRGTDAFLTRLIAEARRVCRRTLLVIEDTPRNAFDRWTSNRHGESYRKKIGSTAGFGFYSQDEWERFFAREQLEVCESRRLSRMCRDPLQPYARSFFVLRRLAEVHDHVRAAPHAAEQWVEGD